MHYNIPLYNTIKEYVVSNPTAFHMPGHKISKGIPSQFLENLAKLDLTEIPGTDNLHYPEGPIALAQRLAAEAFGADSTFFLVNGSTCGVHAMIMSMCKVGDKLIVARDCHRSVIGGMMLAGVKPVYVKPQFDANFGISSIVVASDIEQALKDNPDAVGVFITRPTYYGICSDIDEIVRVTHSHGKILAVDEAHGAHLKFKNSLPPCAIESGADICVQSAHKTIPAFTQGAYLHVKGERVDIERLKFNLRMLQTSSPSYIIMASLDLARAIMAQDGEMLLERLLDNVQWFNEAIQRNDRLLMLTKSHVDGMLDKTRIVINTKNTGKTGFEADKFLREKHNVQVEMSDLYNIVCISTISDTREDFERLLFGLRDFTHSFKHLPPLADTYIRELKIPPQEMEMKDVMNASSVSLRLHEAVGRVCKDIITPYPPGIPVICPGEVILEDAVEYIEAVIKSGGNVNGLGRNMELSVI